MFGSSAFWLGCVYVCFPLGLLLYGWNDLGDADSDRINPRKNSWLFGARPDEAMRRRLPLIIALVQVPFVALFVWIAGVKMLGWFAALLLVNATYNTLGFQTPARTRSAEPIRLLVDFCLGQLALFCATADAPAMVFSALFAMQSHLFGQLMDIDQDRVAGRHEHGDHDRNGAGQSLVGADHVRRSCDRGRLLSRPVRRTVYGCRGDILLVGHAVRSQPVSYLVHQSVLHLLEYCRDLNNALRLAFRRVFDRLSGSQTWIDVSFRWAHWGCWLRRQRVCERRERNTKSPSSVIPAVAIMGMAWIRSGMRIDRTPHRCRRRCQCSPDLAKAIRQTEARCMRPAFATIERCCQTVRPDIVAVCPRHVDQHRDMILAAIDCGSQRHLCRKAVCPHSSGSRRRAGGL